MGSEPLAARMLTVLLQWMLETYESSETQNIRDNLSLIDTNSSMGVIELLQVPMVLKDQFHQRLVKIADEQGSLEHVEASYAHCTDHPARCLAAANDGNAFPDKWIEDEDQCGPGTVAIAEGQTSADATLVIAGLDTDDEQSKTQGNMDLAPPTAVTAAFSRNHSSKAFNHSGPQYASTRIMSFDGAADEWSTVGAATSGQWNMATAGWQDTYAPEDGCQGGWETTRGGPIKNNNGWVDETGDVGGLGGEDDNTCRRCKQPGHFARECPQPRDDKCFNCGQPGHISRECSEPKKSRAGDKTCRKCNEVGHIARDCPTGGGGGGDRACHKCGDAGHMMRECTSSALGAAPDGGGSGMKCYNCQQYGHKSSQCTNESAEREYGSDPRTCNKCGHRGHISRDCREDGGDFYSIQHGSGYNERDITDYGGDGQSSLIDPAGRTEEPLELVCEETVNVTVSANRVRKGKKGRQGYVDITQQMYDPRAFEGPAYPPSKGGGGGPRREGGGRVRGRGGRPNGGDDLGNEGGLDDENVPPPAPVDVPAVAVAGDRTSAAGTGDSSDPAASGCPHFERAGNRRIVGTAVNGIGGFGVSDGDLVAVGTFAWNIYRACKNASSDFEEVGHEVVALCTPIKELEDEARNPESILNRAGQSKLKELDELLKNCRSVLRQLEWLLTKYKRLGTQSRRTWDRIKFGREGLQDVREKLTFHTSAISLFLTTLGTGSLGQIEKKLDEIVEEIRAGKREPTTLSVVDDDWDAETQWNKLKDELLEEGLTRWEVESHKSDIKKKLREVVDRGESLQSDALCQVEQTANSISQDTDDAGRLEQAPVSHDFEDNQVNEKGGLGPPTLVSRDDFTAPSLATAPQTEKQMTDMDSNFPVTNDPSANQGTDSQTLDNIKSFALKLGHSLPQHCGFTSPYDSSLNSVVEENHVQPRGSQLNVAAYLNTNTSGIEQSSPANTSPENFTTSRQALTQSVSTIAPRRLPSPAALLRLTPPDSQPVVPQPTLPQLSNNIDDWNPLNSFVAPATAGGLTNNQSQPQPSHITSSESPASNYFYHWVPPEQPSLKRQASEVFEYHEGTTEYDGSGQVRKRTVIRRSSTPTTVPNSPKFPCPQAFDAEARSIAMGPVSSCSDLVPTTVAASNTADSTHPPQPRLYQDKVSKHPTHANHKPKDYPNGH